MVSPCSKFVGTNPHGLIGISRARLCLLRQVAQRRILVAAEPSASPGSEAKNSNVRRPRRKAASAPAGDVPTAGGTPPAAPPSQPKRQRRQTPTLKQQKVAKLPQPVEEQQRQATKRRRRRPQQPPPLEQQQVAVPAQQQPAPKQGPPAALAVAQQAAAGVLQRQLPRKQQPRQPTSTTSPRQAPEGQHPPRQQQQQRQRQQQREPAEPAGQQQREAAHATRQLPSVDDAPPPDWAAMEGRLSAALEAAGEAEALARDRKRGQELQRQQRRQRLEKLLLLLQQQQQQQAQAQEQPTWTVEGAEALCYLGMAPEQAVQALSAAHAYATRRQQQAAEAAEQSAAGAAEAAGSQPGQQAGAAVAGRGSLALVPPVSAGQVEAVSRELTATAKVPVAQLRHVLETSPQLLACTPAELRKQVGAWWHCGVGWCCPLVAIASEPCSRAMPAPVNALTAVCFALPAARGGGIGVAAAAAPGCCHPGAPRHAEPRLPCRGEWAGAGASYCHPSRPSLCWPLCSLLAARPRPNPTSESLTDPPLLPPLRAAAAGAQPAGPEQPGVQPGAGIGGNTAVPNRHAAHVSGGVPRQPLGWASTRLGRQAGRLSLLVCRLGHACAHARHPTPAAVPPPSFYGMPAGAATWCAT